MGRVAAIAVVALFLLPAGVAQAKSTQPRTDGSTPAPGQIAQQVTHVPASTLNAVGAGTIAGPNLFDAFKLDHPFTSDGKPALLTMNFAWCPHCAANNWALAVALSRFGTLSALRVINSGTHYCKIAHDPCSLRKFPCFPNTQGLSFFGAHFKSRYLSFFHLVLQDVKGHNLQKPTAKEQTAIQPFDPEEATPAVNVGGAFGFLNSGYSPGVLAHKTWSQIAGSLADPHSGLAKHIDGLANLFSAAICNVTKGKPGAVCKSKGVQAAAGRLASAMSGPPGGPP